MNEETIPIARIVLRDLFAWEMEKEDPDPDQIRAIGLVISQLGAIHRIWFGG